MKMDRKIKAGSRSKEARTNGKRRAASAKPASNPSNKHPLISYEHIPIGIVETSLDGKFLNVNEEFCRITGYERQELLQLSIKDVTYEEDYSFDIQLHERLIAGKIPYYKIEKRLKCKEGGVVWVELTRSLVREPRGAARHSVGAVLDISDRKHVERVLHESVERQRLATAAARMFTWEWNFQTHLYTLSDSFVQVLGFSGDLLPQNNIEDVFKLIPVEDVQQVRDAVDRAIESHSDLRSLQYRMVNPENGETVWLEGSGKIVYDDLGNAVRMFGVAQNITKNKMAEAALEFARRQAEQSADRTARLQKITAALSVALTPSHVAKVLATEGAPAFGAVSSSMMTLSEDGQMLEMMYSTSPESLVRSYEHFPVFLNVPAADAVRSRQPIWIESQQQYLERYPHLADQIKIWGHQAAIAIPMISKERILGVLTMSFEDVLVFNRDDQDYAWTLARQGAQALERARAEDALRESEERFRALVSQATAGISQSNTNNQLIFVNPKFCEMLGYSKSELLGKTIWELTHPDDLEENRRLFEGMISRGESYQFEKRFVCRDGSVLWTNVSVSPIRDMAGKPKGGVAVIVDITERKRAEQALAEFARQQEALHKLSDQLHRTNTQEDVFEVALDAVMNALQCDRASILLFDDTDKMRFVAWRGLSDGYRRATDGHSPWGRDAREPEPICLEDVRKAELDEQLRAIIENEGIGSLAFIPLISSGKLIGKFMAYFNAPHRFNEDEVELGLTIANNLAFGIERKRAEQALRQSEERYRAVVESQVEMLCRFQPDGKIIFVNAAYARGRGTTPEVLMNGNFWEFIPDGDRQAVRQMLDMLTPDAPEVQIENRFQTAEGERWMLWTNRALTFDASGKVLEAQSSGIDITERKQAENRLALLADVSEMLRNFQDPYELMYTIAKAIGEHFRVKRVLFNEIDLAHDREVIHRDYHNGLPSVAGIHKISDYSSITSAEVATGKTVVNADSKTDPRTAQDYEKTYALSGERSYVAIPMMRENQWTASLWVSDDVPRTWSPEEISLLETIAERTWTFIEKQRINGALQESEQRFREIFETAGVSVWLEDFTRVKEEIKKLRSQGVQDFPAYFAENPDFVRGAIDLVNVLDVNNETLALFKAENKEELLGSLSKVFAPETEGIFIEELIALAEGQEMLRSETQVRALDGSPISVLFTVHFGPQTDDHSHVVVTLTDITERKQAEEALRDSEERFRAILRQATAGIARKDLDGRLLFVNQAFCSMLGYTESELLGKTVWEFMHPEDAAENQRAYRRLIAEGIPVKLERRFLRQDGSVIWVDASLSPIMDAEGKLQSAVAVEVDITGRKQAEEALHQLNLQLENRVQQRTARLNDAIQTLRDEIAERRKVEEALRRSEAAARENEEKLSTLFDLLPVGISFLDLNGEVIQTNPALENILKLPKAKEQLSDQVHTSRQYIRPNGTLMPASEFASQRALTEQRTVYNVETGIVLEDGTVIWTSVSAAPVTVADVGAVVVTVDITEGKRAERALQESRERLQILSQRLVEVQEEERRAIARELHDRVGQTLAALNINLIIINGQLADKVDQQVSGRLSDSMKLVTETITLVRDVMSNLRPSVLDDYGLEAALQSYLDEYMRRYEIKVTMDRSASPVPRLGSSIEMTFLRIAQEALMNIARHAQATHVILSLRQDGGAICMTVQDNGVGIQSGKEGRRPGSHGLTIMRERAEAFGGTLQVVSAPGQGTRVEVSIPVESHPPSLGEKERLQ